MVNIAEKFVRGDAEGVGSLQYKGHDGVYFLFNTIPFNLKLFLKPIAWELFLKGERVDAYIEARHAGFPLEAGTIETEVMSSSINIVFRSRRTYIVIYFKPTEYKKFIKGQKAKVYIEHEQQI